MSTKSNDELKDLENLEEDQGDGFVQPTRLELLKRKATTLGIKFRDNIGEAALEAKITAHEDELENGKAEEKSKDSDEDSQETESEPKDKPVDTHSERMRSQRLHRIIVRPVDPRRTQLNGELITVGNSVLGTTGKFVPFNKEQGYHVPEIIYNALKSKTFTEFYTVEDKDGNEHTKSRQRKAFIIEDLEPLTERELDAIRERQRATLQDE